MHISHTTLQDATCDIEWNAFRAYLNSSNKSAPPRPTNILQYELGTLAGCRLTFTDASWVSLYYYVLCLLKTSLCILKYVCLCVLCWLNSCASAEPCSHLKKSAPHKQTPFSTSCRLTCLYAHGVRVHARVSACAVLVCWCHVKGVKVYTFSCELCFCTPI